MRSRRGFTLVEIMLALVLVLVVSGSIYRVLFNAQRVSRAQAASIALQSTVRGAALVVANELRELSAMPGGSPAQNDILTLAPQAISYRAARGFGYTCQTLPAGLLRLARNGFTGHRDPQAGRDSALVYAPGSPAPSDSGWVALAVTSVSSAAPCPGAAGAGITLSVAGGAPVGSLPGGIPVRIFEIMELASYRSDRQTWLGLRSLSSGEAIQPLFGPLAEPNGFRLEFSDGSGAAAALPQLVKTVSVTLRAGDSLPANGGSPVQQLTTSVTLRNAIR
jgi:prepilin-type N-terminal cleavage/methylation domain-containing protein